MSKLKFAPALVEKRDLKDGAFILRSPVNLGHYGDSLCSCLSGWATSDPNRTFLAERTDGGEWRHLSYSRADHKARAIAQALLDRGITAEQPILILSDNGIDHALMLLGGLFAGIPVSQVSQPYSLMSRDFGKLRHVFDVLKPSVIFAENGQKFERALAALDLDGVEVVVSRDPTVSVPMTLLKSLTDTLPGPGVDAALAAITPDTIAKILFTSGSTGLPKGVINTHRMLCSNQQAVARLWPFVTEHPPVLVDWLPWSHTFGSNHNFNMVMRNGGSMYINSGKPAPGLIETTVANLRDVAPTIYFDVPRGYDMLIPYLEADAAFRDHFFSRMDTVFYAGAALPSNLWKRLENLSLEALGEKIAMTSAWGSTETAPMATSVHFRIDRAGVIGLPAPGTEIKLVPNGDKLEARVRGPNVTPGYYRRDDLTKAAFDADGFYRIGDAVRLAEPDDPARGLIFAGRVAEDFKLSTGSWVNVATVRMAAITAGDPMIGDAVITGHDRDEIGVLIFPNVAGLAQIAGLSPQTDLGVLIAHPDVADALRKAFARHNADHPASSQRVARLMLMTDPPDMDAGEITDKGYVNQRAVLENRKGLVAALYRDDEAGVMVF